MEIELVTGVESVKFEVKDTEAENFISSHLEEGREFDIFFPDWEFKVEK